LGKEQSVQRVHHVSSAYAVGRFYSILTAKGVLELGILLNTSRLRHVV